MKVSKRIAFYLSLLIIVALVSACASSADDANSSTLNSNEANNGTLTRIDGEQLTYILPEPQTDGNVSVEQALANRRSQRNFQDRAISADQLSQILWAAYGITQPSETPRHRGGLRTTPSAGSRYPLEIYVIVGNVEGIEPGVYRYIALEHKIVRIIDIDVRYELMDAAVGQRVIVEAPVSVFYSAVYERSIEAYGGRLGIRYAHIELGHSAQNVYLQAVALGLGSVAVGVVAGERAREILNLPTNEEPLYIMPIGYFYEP